MTAARRSDPETSHDAGMRAARTAPLVEERVYSILLDYPDGLTDDELTDAYELSASLSGWEPVKPDTPRKRRSDLTNDGRVVMVPGQKRDRKHIWKVNA